MPPKIRDLIKEPERAGFKNGAVNAAIKILFTQISQNQLQFQEILAMMYGTIKSGWFDWQ